MTIKRFGVQLAASGVVVLLGALGVAQAQRESKRIEPSEWDLATPPEMSPPPPIAADLNGMPLGSGLASPSTDPLDARAMGSTYAAYNLPNDDSQAAYSDNAVRQVNHEQTFTMPAQQPDALGTADPAGYASSPIDAGPSSFAMPAWGGNGASPTDDPYTSVADPTAVADAGQPAADYGAPAGDYGAPAADYGTPAGDYGTPAGDYGTPAGDYGTPANNYGAAAGNYEPQAADYGPEAGAGDFALPAMTGQAAPSYEPTAQETFLPEASAYDPGAAAPTNSLRGGDYGAMATVPSLTAQSPVEVADEPTGVSGFSAPAAMAYEAPVPVPMPTAAASERLAPLGGDAFAAPMPLASSAPAMRVASASPNLTALTPLPSDVVLNEPGDRRLDGMQTPSIMIHKRAPDQVKVGKPATFVISLQNVGGVEALDVQVHDRVPAGMRLVDASPQPQIQGDQLLWQLGAVEPGGERTVSMQLVPEQEGELGSVARVTFEAAASVRTVATRPALKIAQRAPAKVLIGQQLEIELELSNPGSGAATGVILQADVPEGLEHPKGRQLDNLIGTLAPGETRRQVLRLRATAPGLVQSQVRLVSDDDLAAADLAQIEVIAPELALELEGPSRRFLERQATYQVSVANVGSAEASNVEIVAYLDRGFSFVSTEFQGQYDPARHAVYWSLAELPIEAKGAVPLTLLPIEQGERAIRLEARGDLNLVARHEKKVSVDALAELTFSITDDADPIEVGSTATYEIRVINRGSRDDSNVQLKLQLPPGLELVSSETDASTDGRGMIVFTPQSHMAARSESVHRVRVRGVQPGTHVVQATVASQEAPVAVTKEESTTVYADR